MPNADRGNYNPEFGELRRVVGIIRPGRRKMKQIWEFPDGPNDDRQAAHRMAFHLIRTQPSYDVYMGLLAVRTGGIWWGPILNYREK